LYLIEIVWISMDQIWVEEIDKELVSLIEKILTILFSNGRQNRTWHLFTLQ
jgi:hypothetical protein